ncbi:MAG: helix-turn-helix domain-containing protein [Erysipelotrichales bacterium]|nr:helix-turn-helix domain-containing protein [Erysipelotrichales bacterium]
METFGQRLSRLRKEHELTQNDIAERLNISAQAISKWENDLTSPDIDSLIRLADIFNISLDELMGREVNTTMYLEKEERKDINKMIFKISIVDDDGDKVNLNLPLAVVKVFLDEDGKLSNVSYRNKALNGIDFNKLIELVEQGVFGELLNIETADGETVIIKIE